MKNNNSSTGLLRALLDLLLARRAHRRACRQSSVTLLPSAKGFSDGMRRAVGGS